MLIRKFCIVQKVFRVMIRTAISFTLILLFSTSGISQTLLVDPMLLKEIETVRSVITNPDNPLWPDWNMKQIPIMIYLPGQQEILINHPNPPEGFLPYEGPLDLKGMKILYRNGQTLIKWDGQNTSTDVYGTETLVLADVLSNQKQWMRGWAADQRPTEEKLIDLPYEKLRVDPYEQLAMVAHEAFHVFQSDNLSEKAADERLVRVYPCLSVKNNVLFALEGDALYDCINAKSAVDFRKAVVRWFAIRKERRSYLSSDAIKYENGNEFIEGTAKYIELALMGALQGRQPDPILLWEQGFRGFDDLGWFREKRLNEMLGNMHGEVNVNNDPYGTSPVRGRLYFSGMAIAAILDRIDPNWKVTANQKDVTLTSLVEEALNPQKEELQKALNEVLQSAEYNTLIKEKIQLEEKGNEDTKAMLNGILNAPNTLLVIDYSKLKTQKVGLSFTAFGVRAVDEERTIYTLVPISAALGSEDYTFEQKIPISTFQDREVQQFKFQLNRQITKEELAGILNLKNKGPWNVKGLSLDLPGVKIKAKNAQISHNGSAIIIEFLPLDGK